ncbi:MAG: T9SS type A sorting domain-containing protein [Chlorobi bacterium]|nr:T9SS type A sorting domain-containing protein [Chlorobiota bacterium]
MKLFKISIVLITFIIPQIISAQINIGGSPLSFDKKYNLKSETDIPELYLPELDNKKLLAEAIENESKDKPWQFGKNIFIDIDFKSLAFADSLPQGVLYRLKIISKGALTLNLKFSEFKIPEKAVLYIYNSDKSDIIGGFTSANMQKSETFATSLIKGDKIILEYFEPYKSDFSGKLVIGRVTHGFRGVGEANKSFGSSGDCNMNVACPDADDWQDQVRSVCMLVTGGSGFCTGTLINNTREDGTPYILTANHCYEDPADLVFWFNWQSQTCDNPSSSPSHDDLSGAVLRARDYESDFCLFEMNDIPPYTYNVYYAGWDNNDISSTSSVCIHHPSADIKKISFDDDASVSDYYLGSSSDAESHWKIVWDRNTTTEPGSSGSPLFNQNHKITGQLHGGYASCDDLDDPDWFGKFSYSWDTGTTPETRLKDWLDPLDLDVTDFEGYDPNVPLYNSDAQLLKINAPEAYYFGKNGFIPSVKIRNRGTDDLTSLKLSYKIDNGKTESLLWTGNLASGDITDIEFNEVNLSFSEHEIVFWSELPNGAADEYLFNDTLRRTFYILENIFFDDFETGNVWELTGEFQTGMPEGLGGENGFPDPETAFSGSNVLGTDLSGLGNYPGDYENDIENDFEYAESPVIDCENFENVFLSFERYAGFGQFKNDKASIEIKNDSSGQIKIWENDNTLITDSIWSKQIFDISEFADGKKIRIKFTLGPTDRSEQYCGWNIDDFTVSGTKKNIPDDVIMQKTIYPNPAEGYFYVKFRNYEKITYADVLISDLSGKIVYKKYFSQEMLKTDINSDYTDNLIKINLPENFSGMFILNIRTNTGEYAGKVVVMNDKNDMR